MITSTVKLNSARAMYIPFDYEVQSDEKGNTLSVTAKDTVVIEYGELTEEQFIKKAEKSVNSVWGHFLGIIKGSETTDTFKVEMSEEQFMELGHVIQPDESKLGLVTRTLKSYTVTYEAIASDKSFHTETVTVKKLVPKQLEKALDEDAKSKGYVMVFSYEKPIESEALYGLEREQFIIKAKVAE